MKYPFLKAAALAAVVPLVPLAVMAQQGVPGAHFIENWDLDGDGQVTLAEAEEMRGDLFYMFDQNDDGVLDDAEYTLFDETRAEDIATNERALGQGPMKLAVEGLAREFNDVDQDGLVSRDEFVGRTADWFKMMDLDGDGVLTTGDFAMNK